MTGDDIRLAVAWFVGAGVLGALAYGLGYWMGGRPRR